MQKLGVIVDYAVHSTCLPLKNNVLLVTVTVGSVRQHFAHCLCQLTSNKMNVVFCLQERQAQYEDEMQQAVQQLEEQFLELDCSQENLTKEQLATIISNVTAKNAAVTSTSINQKIDEMHDSLEFKYKRANVGHESDKGGRKSASSRRSKGNSGKK